MLHMYGRWHDQQQVQMDIQQIFSTFYHLDKFSEFMFW